MEKLNLGNEKDLLAKSTQIELQKLWDSLPNEEASVEDHREYLKTLNDTRQPLAKVVKHLNRLQVIANTQMTKARMREHINGNLSIFDFGINPSKDQGSEAE